MLSHGLKIEPKLAAQDGEYGIFQIAGTGESLNLLCYWLTFGFTSFSPSCIAASNVTLKICDGDGRFASHVVELTLETTTLTKSLADAARLFEEYTFKGAADLFGAVRNFDFYCDIAPILTQPGGGYLCECPWHGKRA